MKRLFILAALTGALYILLWPLHPYPFSYALKATPVILLGVMAQQLLHGRDRWLYSLALLGSATGDMFLDIDRVTYLKPALMAFLLTQLAYIVLFAARRRLTAAQGGRFWLALSLPPLLAVLLLWQFYPATGAMWWPVVIYVICLTAMTVLALLSGERILAAGGALFMLADSLIGVNRFWFSFENSTPVIVSIYITAQLLIGYSLLRPWRRT